MSYLTPERKQAIDDGEIYPSNSIDLNYKIYTIVERYLQENQECYTTYNDIVGALECAKMEMYRKTNRVMNIHPAWNV